MGKLVCWVAVMVSLAFMMAGCARREPIPSPPVRKEIRVTIQEEIPFLFPLDTVLVIDQSGSMLRTTDPSGFRMDAAMTFVDFLNSWAVTKQSHRLGIVNFGTEAPQEKSTPLMDIRQKRDWLKQRLAEQKVEFSRHHLGDTMFINAFKEAKRLLEDANAFHPERRPALIVLTDGRPDDGTGGPLEPYFRQIEDYVNKELAPYRIPIYLVAIDQRDVYWPSNRPYWERICTSRRTFKVNSVKEAERVYLDIISDLLGLDWEEIKTQKVKLPPYLERVSFTLFKLNPEMHLRILNPSGKEITPKTSGVVYRADEVGSRYEIYSIPDPEPGEWTVEPIVAGGQRYLGKVTMLMHSLFVTTIIHSPKNPHPLKMPMRFEVEFRRRDGRTVEENPKYPLAIYTKVWAPNAKQPSEVSFRREGASFVGKSEIPTDVEGEYVVDLMVKGGGETVFHHQEKILVKPLPYLKIGDPQAPWHLPVKVEARLMQSGQPQKVNQVFHPTESAQAIGIFRVLRGENRQEVLIGYLEPRDEPMGTVMTCVLPPVNTVKETISQMLMDLVRLRLKNVFRTKPQRTIDRVELRLIGKLLNGEEYRSQPLRVVYERVDRFGFVFPWTIALFIVALALRWWFVIGPSWARPFGELVLGNQSSVPLGRGRYKKRILTIGSKGDIRITGQDIRPIEGRICVTWRRSPHQRGKKEKVCIFQRAVAQPGKFIPFLRTLLKTGVVLGVLTIIVTVVIIEMHPWVWIAWQIGFCAVVVGGLLGWVAKKWEEMGSFRGGEPMTQGWTMTVGGILIRYR